jgi:hypothetical protein
MKQEEQTLFIWLLEYGEQNHDRSLSCHDVINDAVTQELIFSRTDPKTRVLRCLYYECFDVTDDLKRATLNYSYPGSDSDRLDQNNASNLKAEYYFRLLEFRELKLARETARQANENSMMAQRLSEESLDESRKAFQFSIAALLISAGLAIFTTTWQLVTPIQIDPVQLQQLGGLIEQSRLSQPIVIQVGPEQLQRLEAVIKQTAPVPVPAPATASGAAASP